MRVMENLTAGVAVVLALGGVQASAAPFSLVSDAPDRVWVLDTATGETQLCQLTTVQGPKLIDMFGEQGTVRESPPRVSEPLCEVAQGPQSPGHRPGYVPQNYTGYSMYAPMDGVSVGYTPGGFVPGGYASAGFPYTFQRPDWGLYGVRPRTVYININ